MPDPEPPQHNTCFRQSLAADIGSPPAWTTGCGSGFHEVTGNAENCGRNWGYAIREALYDQCRLTADAVSDMEQCENGCATANPTDPVALAACLSNCASVANAKLIQIENDYNTAVGNAGAAYTTCRGLGCVPN